MNTQVYGQAQAWICWTDTFTRTTSFGLGSDYTWNEVDTSFDLAADSTYHVNGTKLVNSPDNFNGDSYAINRAVPTRGTVQFDFTTNSSFVDWPYFAVVFGTAYSNGYLNLAIERNNNQDQWYLAGDWNGGSADDLAITIATNKTYTVKMAYDDEGNYARKVWETGQTEPDWMQIGPQVGFIVSTEAWLDIYFAQDIVSVDNLKFCIEESFPHARLTVVAQAAAQIVTKTPNAQARAQITNKTPSAAVQAFINLETTQLDFLDNFNRTTNRGPGDPRYQWHNAGTTIYVDGSQLVITPNATDSYTMVTTPFGVAARIEFDITLVNPLADFSFNVSISGGTDTLGLYTHLNSGTAISSDLYRNGSIVTNNGTTVVSGTTYTVKLLWNNFLFSIIIYSGGVALSSAIGASAIHVKGATNVTIDLVGTTSSNVKIDNLFIGTSATAVGQARPRIKKTDNNKHGQAQAKIKAIGVQRYGQAQTYVGHFQPGQAQADIVATYYGFAQAQARIIAAGANEFQAYGQAQGHIGVYIARGFGQARAQITINWGFGQAQAYRANRTRVRGQAKALIRIQRWVWAQAQACIFPRVGYGQAAAMINIPVASRCGNAQGIIKQSYAAFAQAQAIINTSAQTGQAQALIVSAVNNQWGQSQGFIVRGKQNGQSQARILTHYVKPAQARARIVGYTTRTGIAQGYVVRSIRQGNAQAYIGQPPAGRLVKYNNYVLPGYLQSESMTSPLRIKIEDIPFGSVYTEQTGLDVKELSLKLLVVDETYALAKEQVLLAGTMLRSNRATNSKLYVIDPDVYYLARTKSIHTEHTAGIRERAAEYEVVFECQPWRYGASHTLTGTTLLDTNNVARTFNDGTWTHTTLTLTGTNITVSGYTATSDYTGFVSVSGTVTDFVVDSEAYTTSMDGVVRDDLVNNVDYQIYVGPGRTLFAVTGATSCTVRYQDRWNL